ncbi:MAG: hypothetical protein WBW87_02105 [Candidatus Cybelea sp.]
MASAKVVSIKAIPWKVSHLCFEVGGILGELDVQLGAPVAAPFDFTGFYGGLSATAAGDPSLLSFNSNGILTAPPVVASLLAALRAETSKAVLDKAVCARQNAYFAKYGSASSIISTISAYYGGGSTANPARIANLVELAQTQADQLWQAYSDAGIAYNSSNLDGVVKTTSSTLNSLTVTTDSSSSDDQSTTITTPSLTTIEEGSSNEESIGSDNFTTATLPTLPADGGSLAGTWMSNPNPVVSETDQEGTVGSVSTETGLSVDTQTGTQAATGKAYAVETEQIVNTDYGYRMPSVESQAQNERAQISLNDQQFALFMKTRNLPNLSTVFQNELSSIDLNVYQMQIGFLKTLLLSPIAGTVTGIYKNPGDPVAPGEPVVRVEDNSTMLLLASVICRGPVAVAPPGAPPPPNSSVSIMTSLFDESGPKTPLSGVVVAARIRGEDDLWDLVVQCANPLDGSGNQLFPIGYCFDYNPTITTLSIT